MDKPILTAFNKQDKEGVSGTAKDFQADEVVFISAKTGMGLDRLTESLEQILRKGKMAIEHVYPYEEAGKIQTIRKYGELLEEEYREEGVFVRAYVPVDIGKELLGKGK